MIYAIYIPLMIISLLGCWALVNMAHTQRQYRRQVNQKYKQRYPLLADPVGIINRINDHAHANVIRTKSTIQSGDRKVQITTTDGRQAWLERLGMYDEQCNNFIHLLKAELNT